MLIGSEMELSEKHR